jgi:hypothetical protein
MVDERHEGQGLGAALLLDVISRVASLSDAIGCLGLLVHAESEQARGFYEHLIPEFDRSPTDPPPIPCTCCCSSRASAAPQTRCRVDRHPIARCTPANESRRRVSARSCSG